MLCGELKKVQRMARPDHLRAPLVALERFSNVLEWYPPSPCLVCLYLTVLSWCLLLGKKQSLQTATLPAFLVSLPSSSQDSHHFHSGGSQFPGKQIPCFRALFQGLIELPSWDLSLFNKLFGVSVKVLCLWLYFQSLIVHSITTVWNMLCSCVAV